MIIGSAMLVIACKHCIQYSLQLKQAILVRILMPRVPCDHDNRFIALSNITESNIDRLFELKLKQAGTLARPYDTVVRAMGWKHNVSVYGDGARPLLQSQKKYARMTVRSPACAVSFFVYPMNHRAICRDSLVAHCP